MKSYLKLLALVCAVSLSAAFLSACSNNPPPSMAPPPAPAPPAPVQTQPNS
jgi:hypothetical protein